MRVITFLIIFLISVVVSAENIKAFTSDGCSLFPDGTFQQNQLWLSCCTAHDYAYWQGGTHEKRFIADEQLHQCITAVGEPEIATLMLAGVRVGGSPYLPTPFRWGYGWSYLRGYKTLTKAEKEQVNLSRKTKYDKPVLRAK
jgi:hypothetical protein|tara:strand:+ start:26 stop:451 length:426 start_codon:yes stop_codon:yes gene_type:complete